MYDTVIMIFIIVSVWYSPCTMHPCTMHLCKIHLCEGRSQEAPRVSTPPRSWGPEAERPYTSSLLYCPVKNPALVISVFSCPKTACIVCLSFGLLGTIAMHCLHDLTDRSRCQTCCLISKPSLFGHCASSDSRYFVALLFRGYFDKTDCLLKWRLQSS